MHFNPIPGPPSDDPRDATPGAPSDLPEESFDSALLALLTEEHDGLWSLGELARTLSPSSRCATTASAEPTAPELEDAVERLFAAGLIHRVGGFVFASRAAHAAQRLAG